MPAQTEDKDQTQFPLRTHTWDSRGKLAKHSPYRLHIIADESKQGVKYFERPINSGNLFYEDNTPAGRLAYKKDEKTGKEVKFVEFEAAHKAYTAPLKGAEALVAANKSLEEKNAELLRELEAIKAEQEKKMAAPADVKTEAKGGKSGIPEGLLK